MALALAVHHTARRSIMAFHGGYHGGVLTFGHGGEAVTVPHDWVLADYNDVDEVEAIFDARGDQLAAVLVEPLQGSGGCIPGDPEFLRVLREQCDRHGVVPASVMRRMRGVQDDAAEGHNDSASSPRIRVRGERRLCANAGDNQQRSTDIRE